TATLFATTSTAPGQLVEVEDTAAFDAPLAATPVVLADGVPNTAMRGVAFAPSGGSTGAPVITGQPQDATISSGGSATLSVGASGPAPLTYQWHQGPAGDPSQPIAGETGTSFTTPALTATTSYWVRVTGADGQADSRTATVTVTVVEPACTGPVV